MSGPDKLQEAIDSTLALDQFASQEGHYKFRIELADSERIALAKEVIRLREVINAKEPPQIDMILHCPACGEQHIDAVTYGWDNPPHRSHLCATCGHVWRPADVPTNGVAAITTKGRDDSPTKTRATKGAMP